MEEQNNPELPCGKIPIYTITMINNFTRVTYRVHYYGNIIVCNGDFNIEGNLNLNDIERIQTKKKTNNITIE